VGKLEFWKRKRLKGTAADEGVRGTEKSRAAGLPALSPKATLAGCPWMDWRFTLR
jgi:hypothetical protein